MEDMLLCFTVRLNVVMKNQFIYGTFKDNEHNAESTLNDGCTEHKTLPKYRKIDIVLDVTNA
jgi:hypothetical protein